MLGAANPVPGFAQVGTVSACHGPEGGSLAARNGSGAKSRHPSQSVCTQHHNVPLRGASSLHPYLRNPVLVEALRGTQAQL